MINTNAGLKPEDSNQRKDMTMNRQLQLGSCALVAAGLAIAATLNVKAQGLGLSASGAAVAEVRVDAAQTGPPISKYIYGQFTEHLGRCMYGGIWAEMLEDRKFYFPVPAPGDIWRLTREQARVLAASPWKVIGPQGTVSMGEKDAFVGKHSPHIQASANGTTVGICQEELGLLKGKEYTGYVILAGDAQVAPVTVSLAWGTGENEKAVQTISQVTPAFNKVPFKYTAGTDTDNGRLTISTAGKGTLNLAERLHHGQLGRQVDGGGAGAHAERGRGQREQGQRGGPAP